MFKFDPHPTFAAPVTVSTPTLDGTVDEQFTAIFQAISIDDFNAYDFASEAELRGFLERTLCGARDVTDAEGNLLAYEDGLRDRLINAPHVRVPLFRAYVAAIGAAARGN